MSVATTESTLNPSNFAGKWQVDESHADFGFEARHLMISKVRGKFGQVEGTVLIGETLNDTEISLTIAASSIQSGDEKRDGHLKSEDFLNVEKFPNLTFQSTSVKELSEGEWEVTGDLTIREVSKPVSLKIVWEGEANAWGQRRIGFAATGEFNRTDWDLTWNQTLETGGLLVGENVKVNIDLELIQQ